MGVPCSPFKRTICGGEPVKDGWGVTKVWPVGTLVRFHCTMTSIWFAKTSPMGLCKAPRVDYPDSAWEDVVNRTKAINKEEQFHRFSYPGLFETCHNLLGIQNCLINFYQEPERMHELIDYITDYQMAVAEQICDRLHPDGVFMHDDWGTRLSTFISLICLLNSICLHTKIYGYYNQGAELIVHHSDSYAATLVPYMIEMGISIWQGVLSTNNIPELIQKYGGQITFMGGIDDGLVDIEGWTPELIQDVVRKACTENGKLYYIPSILQWSANEHLSGRIR